MPTKINYVSVPDYFLQDNTNISS